MKVSKIALGLALAFGGASVVATAPVAAQQAPARKFNLSKEERAAIAPLQTAVNAKDFATAAGALPAAQAAAQGADARYIVATLQLQLGLGTNNKQMQAAAIDALIASGGAPQSDLAVLYKNQGALAQEARDFQKTEAAWNKWVELAPNDTNAILALAELKASLRKPGEAVTLLDRAIEARKAAGQPVPDAWYKRALKFAYEGKMGPQSVKLSQGLVRAYPTTENWRDSLLIYRDLNRADPKTNLDVLRLMRAAKALNGERDFYELADTLNNGGLPGESKAVLDEGVAARMIDPNKAAFKDLIANAGGKVAEDKRTLASQEAKAAAAPNGTLALGLADAYYGYGNYSKAAELYRTALQKGGVDAGVVNTRLGMALAQGGQKAEAEAAFRAVTGPRADLASYWLIWLGQRG
jgi:tetratricopeptide (TPR) repeat protein